MKRVASTLLTIASVAALAMPALAKDLVIPEDPVMNLPTGVASEAQARAAMSLQGVRNLGAVYKVGNYWEGQGVVSGHPVIAYLFESGALETKPAASTQTELRQSAELPSDNELQQ